MDKIEETSFFSLSQCCSQTYAYSRTDSYIHVVVTQLTFSIFIRN